MKVSIDVKKGLHLILLIVLTITFGQLLIQHYDWKPLSAYGITCSLVCQISNVILKLNGTNQDEDEVSPGVASSSKKNKKHR
mmetsp:Transcript_5133/g.6633  ORF Transcript_5133/g.6633 Transcript_5133/m.6633 type:complete len:82 (+) Transcript_5133:248-493(+)